MSTTLSLPSSPQPIATLRAQGAGTFAILGAMVANEVRLRTRRLSTIVVFLVVVALTWSMVADPAGGHTMISSKGVRLLYSSETLALGSAVLTSFIAGIASFYLARGRVREDLVHGTGSILATTPVSNALIVFARWLGAVTYLAALMGAVMLTMMVLQSVRGEGPVQPLVYLRTYALLLLPSVMFAAAVAILCDSIPFLMGKLGDVLYFILWMGQFGTMPQTITRESQSMPWLSALDFSGLATAVHGLKQVFGTSSFSFGGSTFNPALAPIELGNYWTWEMVAMRLISMLLTLLPLLPAIWFFHRYSPDKVKGGAKKRTSIYAWANNLLRPVTRVLLPFLALAVRLPTLLGQVIADMVLVLMANPIAAVALAGLWLAGLITTEAGLTGMAYIGIAVWGVLICDVAVRDYQSGTEALTAAVPGGASRRFSRQLVVTWLLGVLYTAPVLTHWVVTAPFRAGVLLTAVFTLGAIASLLGRTTKNSRAFLALFLFGLYLTTQIKGIPWFDALGTYGFATTRTTLTYLAAGAAAVVLGWAYNRRLAR